jgi:hypothetical protein
MVLQLKVMSHPDRDHSRNLNMLMTMQSEFERIRHIFVNACDALTSCIMRMAAWGHIYGSVSLMTYSLKQLGAQQSDLMHA